MSKYPEHVNPLCFTTLNIKDGYLAVVAWYNFSMFVLGSIQPMCVCYRCTHSHRGTPSSGCSHS